jgi:soluble lytic murein transglycosylase-like protein
LNETVSGAFVRVFAVAEQVAFLIALTAVTLLLMRSNMPGAAPIRPFTLPQAWIEKFTAPAQPSVFDQEAAMTSKELLDRWNPFIEEAAKKFDLPASWVRAVIARESGGRTMMAEGVPIASSVGAVGIMQLMPDTYNDMRAAYGLGDNPADPHDSIIAGAAYLKWLHRKYGFPNMFAAYNDGPANFDKYLSGGRTLPAETVAYLSSLSNRLSDDAVRPRRRHFTREARVSQSYAIQG